MLQVRMEGVVDRREGGRDERKTLRRVKGERDERTFRK